MLRKFESQHKWYKIQFQNKSKWIFAIKRLEEVLYHCGDFKKMYVKVGHFMNF